MNVDMKVVNSNLIISLNHSMNAERRAVRCCRAQFGGTGTVRQEVIAILVIKTERHGKGVIVTIITSEVVIVIDIL